MGSTYIFSGTFFLRVATLAAYLATTTACNNAPTDGDALESGTAIRTAPLVAFGILNFLNDDTTVFSVLDDDVGLNARTASNLIAHRDGPDAVFGTEDDKLFDDIDEVDAVYWVGPKAMMRLADYAQSAGWLPEETDPLGEFDRVAFTYGEAIAVLEFANTASAEALDDDVPLDARAVNSIVQARPLTSIAQLAGLYFVGRTALTRLQDFTAAAAEPPSGSTPWSNDFTHDEEMDIPDNDSNGVATDVTVSGAPSDAFDIVVTFEVQHDAVDQLSVELIFPNGHRHSISEFENAVNNVLVLDNVQRRLAGGSVNGAWTLVVRDQTAGSEGVLRGWNMHVGNFEEPTPGYQISGVWFDENGVYEFLIMQGPWQAERVVDSGFISHDGSQVVLTDVQVPNDPDDWQQIAVSSFDRLWDCCLRHQYSGVPLEIGPRHKGTLHLGRVVDSRNGQPYVMSYWKDIDDSSFAWLYEKDASGQWVQAVEVYLN
jgi:subtilisin-like proprotein convertase family protein